MNKDIRDKISRYSFFFILFCFGLIVGLLFMSSEYNRMADHINYLNEYSYNCTEFKNIGLYKELKDNGLGEETYILNNTGFEVVKVDR